MTVFARRGPLPRLSMLLAALPLLSATVTLHGQPQALAQTPAAVPCTRDIVVPVSATGASVVIDGDGVNGIYPDLLRGLEAKTGCRFVFSVVPRARQEALFETGKADLLLPATRTAARDRHGVFVPMMGSRATLISIAGYRPTIRSAQELLDQRDLRVAVVRGFDYGEQYHQLLKTLAQQGRLFTEVNVAAVARLMRSGAIDMTIMAPTILAGAIRREPRVNGLELHLRIEPIPELPWGLSGAYISRSALKEQDQALLAELLEKTARSGAVLEGFQKYHRPEILADSVRPR